MTTRHYDKNLDALLCLHVVERVRDDYITRSGVITTGLLADGRHYQLIYREHHPGVASLVVPRRVGRAVLRTVRLAPGVVRQLRELRQWPFTGKISAAPA